MSGSSRVSIPNNVRKTIQNIKEIVKNHNDDEIYAMLKECNMDPNETAQKLLFQDTFHEVRRKRDKRKENLNNREPSDSRWRPGIAGRGGRGGKGNFSSRYISHDVGGVKSLSAGKENGVNQSADRGIPPTSSPVSPDVENKATIPTLSSVTGIANGPTNVAYGSPIQGHTSQVVGGSGISPPEGSSAVDVNKIGSAKGSEQFSESMTPTSVLGVYSSASDPVLVPSLDSRLPGVVGTIKREVGSERASVEPTVTVPAQTKSVSHDLPNNLQINNLVSHDVADCELSLSLSEKSASEIANPHPFNHGKLSSKSQGVERNHLPESSQAVSSSTHTGSSASRPSSNYGSRSQLIGTQKVGLTKEWKPKPTSTSPVQASGTTSTSNISPVTVEASAQSLPPSSVAASEETTSKLQKKLEELHLLHGQHVIIPSHLQVPEAERQYVSFGSFDATFLLNTSFANGPNNDKVSTTLSESSQETEETAEEPSPSIQIVSTPQEGDYPDHPQSPTHMPENLSSGEADIPPGISAVPEYDQSKPETVSPPGGPQYSAGHTAPNYSNFGLMPTMVGSQFTPFESSEPQVRDASRLPNFVVQQPFDPSASYYTQFYRPGADGDGRFSPFLAPGATNKYNGNIAVLSTQTGQSLQESGNSIVLSTAGPTPLVTQAAGAMQSSIAMTQQPVPVFRQPAGVHISHYPPNYMPYSQYFSPVYLPPPTIHHFLSNAGFPQQPPTGSIYPPPAAANAAVKYSLSQYKPGNNTGNSTHSGMPAGYGPYSSAPASYNPSPAVTSGNNTGNEDLAGSQYKENNVYITGQQSEGSAVWIPAPGRDISGLQASSFYNLPPQGQHVSYAPTQPGHTTFSGMYHPTQTVAAATVHPMLQQSQTMAGAVEMVGPPAGVYQQQPPQRSQINWANNY